MFTKPGAAGVADCNHKEALVIEAPLTVAAWPSIVPRVKAISWAIPDPTVPPPLPPNGHWFHVPEIITALL